MFTHVCVVCVLIYACASVQAYRVNSKERLLLQAHEAAWVRPLSINALNHTHMHHLKTQVLREREDPSGEWREGGKAGMTTGETTNDVLNTIKWICAGALKLC